MDTQNAELKTNEEYSEQFNFFSSEENRQLAAEVLTLCVGVLQGLKQDVAELRADLQERG